MLRTGFGIVVFALALNAQGLPGQYPPGGQIPGSRIPGGRIPGQYPPNGPRQGPPDQPSGRRGVPSRGNAEITTTTLGILRQVTPKFLVIESDDHRVIWYRLSEMIEVTKESRPAELASFTPGDYVGVDSTSTPEGEYTAVSVAWRSAGTEKDRQAASRTWDLPSLPSNPEPRRTGSSASSRGDDDRPIFRRRNPEKKPEPEPERKAEAQAPPAATVPEPADDPAPPSTSVRPPDAPRETDDPGRPVLRRRTPAEAARRQEATAPAIPEQAKLELPGIDRPKPASPPREQSVILPAAETDTVIARAREASEAYSKSLPNFFAKQITTRSRKQGGSRSWDTLDVVTADVAYEDGKETYANIKIGNKAVSQKMEDIDGSRSTGEFSSILEDLFDLSTDAQFRRSGTATIRNRAATLYNFEVPRERSHWRIIAPSQLFYPAEKGTIWVDKETSRVLRIELQARGLPTLFPFDTVETAVDYDFVRLGDMGQYLVPVEADALVCVRGTPDCSRNHIEFRNYRKFGSQSDVRFDEPQN